jgi:hypothetical protein
LQDRAAVGDENRARRQVEAQCDARGRGLTLDEVEGFFGELGDNRIANTKSAA